MKRLLLNRFVLMGVPWLLNGLVLLGLRTIWVAGYGEGCWIPEGLVSLLTNACLAIGGGAALMAAVLSIYLLLSKTRLWLSIPFVFFFCIPTVFVSSLWLFALLFFLRIV